MAVKIRNTTSEKKIIRYRRKTRIRSRIEGDLERPRLVVYRSNCHIYAHVVNDLVGQTLVTASTLEKDLKKTSRSNVSGAKTIGELIAKRSLEKGIKKVVFDRAGYLYHGRVKALADAAREAGLEF